MALLTVHSWKKKNYVTHHKHISKNPKSKNPFLYRDSCLRTTDCKTDEGQKRVTLLHNFKWVIYFLAHKPDLTNPNNLLDVGYQSNNIAECLLHMLR
jgi:hypothetical protein